MCHAHKIHIERTDRNIYNKWENKKKMVTKIKPDFNNIRKASSIMAGIITEFQFHLDGRRQGMFVLDGICQAGKPVIC